MGNIQKSEALLKEAEETLIERKFQSSQVPKSILENKIRIQKAFIAKEAGNLKKAADLLTIAIEEGDIYDPSDRKKCLEELKKIFIEKELDYSDIDKMLNKFIKNRRFEYLFLVDASYSMTGLKIKNAIASIHSIFENYIQSEDRVGYMFFNDDCHNVFHLTEKGPSQVQLESYLSKIPDTKGSSRLIEALLDGLKEFEVNNSNFYKIDEKKKTQIQWNRWLILITDGSEEHKRIKDKHLAELKKRFNSQDINILTIGYTYNEKKINFLQKLCQFSEESEFIELDRADNLEPFFNRLTEGPVAPTFNLESFQD